MQPCCHRFTFTATCCENIIWWKPGFREEPFSDSRRIEATRLSLEEGSLKQLLSPLLPRGLNDSRPWRYQTQRLCTPPRKDCKLNREKFHEKQHKGALGDVGAAANPSSLRPPCSSRRLWSSLLLRCTIFYQLYGY